MSLQINNQEKSYHYDALLCTYILYIYDGIFNFIRRTSDNTILYTYDTLSQAIETFSNTLFTLTKYTHDFSCRPHDTSTPSSIKTPASIAFSLNANGNISEYLNLSDGTTTAHYEYDAFGQQTVSTGTAPCSFGFSTKYLDEETDLVYYGFRYYHPEMGRWLNRDPIEETGGVNLYGYAVNSPLNYFDPLGLCSWWNPNPVAHAKAADPENKSYYPRMSGGGQMSPTPPSWHKNRNKHNRCPKKKPPTSQKCSEGKEWTTDPNWYAEIKGGKGASTYRSDKGDECVYDANGNLIEGKGTYNFGPKKFSLNHILNDVWPWVTWGD